MPAQPAEDAPARRRLWSLSEDVLVEAAPGGDQLVAATRWGDITIDDPGPLVRDSLQRMSLGPVSVENLPVIGESFRHWQSGADAVAEPWSRLHRVLDRLGCCVVQSLGLEDESGPMLSVAPVSRRAGFWLPPELDRDRPIRLSRYAALRVGDRHLRLESPLAQHVVLLHRPMGAWVVGSLGSATTIAEVSTRLRIAEPVLRDIIAYLVGSGMVLTSEPGEPGRPPRFAEDDDPSLIPWSPDDLQFHARTRMGRRSGPAGAVFPYADRLPAEPVTKPPPPGRRYPLYRPPLADLAAADPPLTQLTELRKPDCDFSDEPLPAEQLGELLFRVGRIRWTKLVSAVGGISYAISDRPYLSTSGLYELELYLSLDRCAGLPRGNYHYDPEEHALTLLGEAESELAELLDTAKVAAGTAQRPPALITVTTRIARLSWMYSGIAYATTLKHVGALQQTLYLAATAMGLASCALAVSDGAVADDALGLDWPAEVSIGEFLVGVKR